MNKRLTRFAAAAGAGLLALSLASCATELPELHADAPSAGPALTLDQNSRILSKVNEVLAAATEARDPALLDSRVTGPALAIRTKQLEVAQILGHTDLVTYFPGAYLRVILPQEDSWPRTVFAITEATEDLQPPRLLALRQESAREPYKLWGWVQLRPGVHMPQFADPVIGAELLQADDSSLLVSPADAVAQYLDLLTHGDQSVFAGNFEPADDDPYRTLIADSTATQQAALDPDDPLIQGSYAWTFIQTPDTIIVVVRTQDGGAMVMAAINATEAMSVVEGAFVRWQGATASALMEGQEPTNYLTQGFSDMIALYIPPAGSTDRIMLLGYSHVQTSASNAAPAAAGEEGDDTGTDDNGDAEEADA